MTIKLLVASLLITGWQLTAFAAPAGQITHLSGIMTTKKADGSTRLLSVKSEVQEGDVLSTEDDTYARVKFADGGEIVLRPNSQVKVENFQYNEAQPERDNMFVGLLKGGLRAVTGVIGRRNKEKVSYQTPTATIGIRGTHFGALFCSAGSCAGIPAPGGGSPPNGLHVDVATGSIVLTNGAGTVQFNAGQFGFVAGPNALPQVIPEGVRVTMPGAIATNRGSGAGIGRNSAADCAAE